MDNVTEALNGLTSSLNDSSTAALAALKESAMSGDSANMLRCAGFMRHIESAKATFAAQMDAMNAAWTAGGNAPEVKGAATGTTRTGAKPGRKSNAEKAALAAAAAASGTVPAANFAAPTDTAVSVEPGTAEVAAELATTEAAPDGAEAVAEVAGQTESPAPADEAPRRRNR